MTYFGDIAFVKKGNLTRGHQNKAVFFIGSSMFCVQLCVLAWCWGEGNIGNCTLAQFVTNSVFVR